MPSTATLQDGRMCDDLNLALDTINGVSLDDCQARCDWLDDCKGISWGENSPPPPFILDRRRALLAQAAPAGAGVCHLMASTPTRSSGGWPMDAGCYAKGARLPALARMSCAPHLVVCQACLQIYMMREWR